MEIIEMGDDSPVVARVSYDVYSPEYKREMVLEWAKSGLSQKGFSRGKGIPDTTFSGWVKRWRADGCPAGFGNEGKDGREVIVFDFSATCAATIRKWRVQGERIIRNPHGEEGVGEVSNRATRFLDRTHSLTH